MEALLYETSTYVTEGVRSSTSKNHCATPVGRKVKTFPADPFHAIAAKLKVSPLPKDM